MRPQLTAFAIAADGALGPARPWAVLEPRRDRRPAGAPPLGAEVATLDGCGMDREGYVWAADLRSACIRIAEGGEIVDAVFLPDGLRTWACAVGGEDGTTLMMCGADDNFHDRMSRKASQLFTLSLA
jgi:sugar lactone lactonase YvrE